MQTALTHTWWPLAFCDIGEPQAFSKAAVGTPVCAAHGLASGGRCVDFGGVLREGMCVTLAMEDLSTGAR